MDKMKIHFISNLKAYIWNTLYKVSNSYSNLTVNNLGNGNIKCFWEISSIDNFRVKFSKSCFCAIRLFDANNNRSRNISASIMKEIQVNQFQSSISFTIPINKGMYYFELGYRKKNGEWRKLAYNYLNLGYRIKKVTKLFENDDWFDPKMNIDNTDQTDHEKAYQLSLNTRTGGSENMI